MARVVDRDRGAKAMMARLEHGYALKVGIFGDAAAEKAVDGHGATVGQIANAHEHGLGPPAREWLRGTVVREEANVRAGLRRAMKALVHEGTAGARRALDFAGFYLVGKIQEGISGGIPPALSPNYLPRKLAKFPGATTPLIASGQMRQAVTHAVLAADGSEAK